MLAVAQGTSQFAGSHVASQSLSSWLRRRGDLSADTILVALGDAPGASLQRRLEPLTRKTSLIVVAPRDFLRVWQADMMQRSFGCVASEDFCVPTLEIAMRNLERSRNNEQRLMGILAERNRTLAEVRTLSARADALTDALAERLLSRSLEASGQTEIGLATVAAEALHALAQTNADLCRALVDFEDDIDASLAPDLNIVAESLVARWAPRVDWSLSVLTSDTPAWLNVRADALEGFLMGFAKGWRRRRSEGDRLEWIIWDAGEDVRLVAIFARDEEPRSSTGTLRDLVEGLLTDISILASACRAGAPEELSCECDADRIAVTYRLPKLSDADPLAAEAGDDALSQLTALARN